MTSVRGMVLVLAGLAAGCVTPPPAPEADAGPADVDAGADEDAGADAGLAVVAFNDGYDGHSWVWNNCSRSMRLTGSEPESGGPYPVAIFLVGTNGEYGYPGIVGYVLPILASHGFVAASLEYENGTAFGAAQNCNLYRDNASCMVRNADDYADGGTHSAVARLCSRAKADCGKGVVLLGHSQGGLTAVQAFQHAPVAPPAGVPLPRLVAAAPMGVGDKGYVAGVQVVDLTSCMDPPSLPVDQDRLLVVNGENDKFFGGPAADQDGGQTELEAITTLACPRPSWDCRRANGSGYLLVQGAQVSSGVAGHEYMSVAPVSFGEPNWISRTNPEPWALDNVAAWLKAQTSP